MKKVQLYYAEGYPKNSNYGKGGTIKSDPMEMNDCIEWADKYLNYERTVKIKRISDLEVN